MDRRKVLLVAAVIVAALGAGLVFVYAQGAEDRAAEQLVTVPVIVATAEIAAGESAQDAATSAKLLVKDVPAGDVVAGSTSDAAAFTGQVALTTIYPGEQLVAQKFGSADQVEGDQLLVLPDGDIAIQVQLTDYGKVGSFTRPGSHVVVFVAPASGADVVPSDGAAGDPSSDSLVPRAEVLLSDVLVLAVGSTTTQVGQVDAAGLPLEVTPLTNLTLALDEDEARKVIGVAGQGNTLWFGLRNDASKVDDPGKGATSSSGAS